MAASFPGAVRPLSSRVDLRDTVIAADVNALQEEVVAIETTIGTANDSNKPLASTWTGTFAQTTSWTTISDRLANIETALVNGVGAGSIYAPKASPTFTGTVTTPLSVAGYVTTTSGGILNSVATIPNSGLTNSSITINGSSVSLGGSVSITGLPTQTGNNGKYLTTDGSTASWATIAQYSLPTQTGNNGKYLTTNGSVESWGSLVSASTSVAGIVQLTDSTSSTSTTTAATANAVKTLNDIINGLINPFLLSGM
jgi:hypothetical protein